MSLSETGLLKDLNHDKKCHPVVCQYIYDSIYAYKICTHPGKSKTIYLIRYDLGLKYISDTKPISIWRTLTRSRYM